MDCVSGRIFSSHTYIPELLHPGRRVPNVFTASESNNTILIGQFLFVTLMPVLVVGESLLWAQCIWAKTGSDL